jgi:hypothetical protein
VLPSEQDLPRSQLFKKIFFYFLAFHGILRLRDEQNRQKEQPTNRQMEIKRAWGVSRAQKP